MRRFWAWLGYSAGRHAGIVSIVGLLITVVLAGGLTQLKFKTDTKSYLNTSDQAYKDDVVYERLFGGQAMVTVLPLEQGKTVADLFTPGNLRKFDQLERELTANKKLVFAVVTPSDALGYSLNLATRTPPDAAHPNGTPTTNPTASVAGIALVGATSAAAKSPGAAARSADFGTTATRTTNALQSDNPAAPLLQRLANPTVADYLLYNNTCYPQKGTFATTQGKACNPSDVDGKGTNSIRKPLQTFFPNPSNAELIVRTPGHQSIDEQSQSATFVTNTVNKFHFDNVARTTTTGAPSLLKNINDYLKGGLLSLGALAAAVMVVILLVLFRVRWRLLPLAIILLGLLWAFGLAGYVGIPLTLATIAGLPTLMGVGIDYAIQMHARVDEEVTISRHPHPIQETSRNLCPALLVVTFDAIFAFVALTFAKVPMIRQFGLLLAVGIAVICLTSIVAPLAALGIREYRSPTKARNTGHNRLGRLVVRLGSLPTRAAIPLAALSLVVFFSGIAVEGRLQLQTDPVQWVNPHSQVIRDINTVQHATGSANEMGVFIRSNDVFNDRTVAYGDKLIDTQMRSHPDKLATAVSPIGVISDLINDNVRTANGTVTAPSHVVPKGAWIRDAFMLAPPGLKRQLATTSGGATTPNNLNIVFRTATPNLQLMKGVVNEIRSFSTANPQVPSLKVPPGISATPSGLAVVGVGLLENLESNRILLTYLAILFVAVFLAIRMLSVIRSLLSLVPVLIATGLASLIAFIFNLKLSPMTAVGGPLVVAACTEFTSLILLRFVEERARNLEPREAMDVASARTGRAFIVSAATAISGIAVISSSSMPLLRGFGTIIGMNVAVALLAALVVLPPMLVWADSGGRSWVSRGMVDRLKRARERERREDAERWPDEVVPADAGHHLAFTTGRHGDGRDGGDGDGSRATPTGSRSDPPTSPEAH